MKDFKAEIEFIYSSAIKAVNPFEAVKRSVRVNGGKLELTGAGDKAGSYDLDGFDRIFVVGAGKATAPMAEAVEDLLGERISGGCISVKYGYTGNVKQLEMIEASHPIPDKNGMAAAKRILEILGGAGEKDLVISLISGGGSALLPLPPEGVSLDDKRAATDLLLKSGASIHEINTVRKHLSLVKGGNMARAAGRATVINLMMSDVVGDDMDVIASGPFVPDDTTYKSAMDVLVKYGLEGAVPPSVSDRIRSGIGGAFPENPGTGSPCFDRVRNSIIASNIICLKAAASAAADLGYNTLILSSMIEGDTAEAALWHFRIAREVVLTSNPVPAPACIISGGETTVRVTGAGLGGRNMEFAMRFAGHSDGDTRIASCSVGTDGSDGPTDAAGAYCDGTTASRARKAGLDMNAFMAENDSYHFFEKLGDLIITGPTNTNVMDIRIMLVR